MEYEVISPVYHNNNNGNGIQSFEKKIMHPKEGKKTATIASQDYSFSSNIHESTRGQDVEEIQNQTKKVLEAFFSSDRAAKSREKRARGHTSKTKIEIDGAKRPHTSILPLYKQNGPDLNDGILKKLRSSEEGKRVLRHKPTQSIESSGSADSIVNRKRMPRTKSFSKAQRNSVVTVLESKSEKGRRSSVDVTYSPETRPEDICSTENKASSSTIQHGRASSDSLIQNIGVQPQQHSSLKHHGSDVHKSQEDKRKQSKQFWKIGIFKRKKELGKSKEEIKENSHHNEAQSGRSKSIKKTSTISSSERHPVSRENSANAYMYHSLTPQESPKPKRTPKLFRKLSRKFSKPDVPTVQRKSSVRSQSLDFVEGDFFDPSSSGDPKANSLPIDAAVKIAQPDNLSQSQQFSSNQTSLTGHATPLKSSVTVTGNHQKVLSSLRSSQTHHRGSDVTDSVRPTTLRLHKKRTVFKKMKEFFRQESSSSDDEMDLRASDPITKCRPAEMEKKSKEKKKDSVHYSKSDIKPGHEDIRKNYQHRASKSLSDVDMHVRNYAKIAEKLKRIADIYAPTAAQYVGPTGRSETPDSYNLSRHGHSINKERSGSQSAPVTRETSLKSGYALAPQEGISSHSMKAYVNMSRSGAGTRNETRITRDQISHRPSGSFDSPHVETSKTSWTERTERERPGKGLEKSSSHAGEAIPKPPLRQPVRHPSSPLIRLSSRNESATPSNASHVFPTPKRSTSPRLPKSRHQGAHESSLLHEVLDHDHVELQGLPLHVEKHVTETTITTSPGMRRKIVREEDITEDVTDALPFNNAGREQENEDFASGFYDTPSVMCVSRVRTTEETEETMEYRTSAVPSEIPNTAAPLPRLHRPRSHTTTNTPVSIPFPDDEEGAVGGEESLEECKLVEQLVKALCKRGDEYNDLDLAKPVINVALSSTLDQMSAENVKKILGQVSSRLAEISQNYPGHSEIFQIAMHFKMCKMFEVLMKSSSSLGSVLRNCTSFVNGIVQRVGGWNTVENQIEETLANTTPGDEEGPGPSGLSRHNDVDSSEKRRNSSDTDDELD